jgi:enoyl-CoA hydratase/carnithine racemase
MSVDVEVEVREGIARVTLNRPDALNALTLAMIEALERRLPELAADPAVQALVMRGAGGKAFCAGGDVRALYDSHHAGGALHREFFVHEYRLDHLLHRYPKPFIAIADGITMGGGMGLAQGSRLRVVGERTRIAMPEVGIGLIPDVGGSYFLSRLPGEVGTYLALTGSELGAADAIAAGLADHYLAADARARVEDALRERGAGTSFDAARAVLRSLAEPAPPAPLARWRGAIDRHFAQPSVMAILESLAAEVDPAFRDWATATAGLMRLRSPTMLAVALRALRLGRGLGLADCLRMEYTIVQHCFAHGDLVEGVRALIIDKDKRPRWRPARTEEVDPAAVEAFFRAAPGVHPLAALADG